MEKAVTKGTRRVYSPYWAKVVAYLISPPIHQRHQGTTVA